MTRFAGSDSAMASLFGGVKSPEYDELANIGTKARAQEKQTAMEADSMVAQSRNKARAIEEGAQYAADAARAQGQANMFGSAMGALGSLGSAGIGAMGSGGGFNYGTTKIGAGGGSVGGIGTFGPNYGF
jgi:hypothetical protein